MGVFEMKNLFIRHIAVFLVLLSVCLLMAACGTDSPFDKYQAAVESLKHAQSFRSEYSQTNESFFDGKADEKTISASKTVAEYFINQGKPEAIITMTIDDMEIMKNYMRGGYSYAADDTYRQAITDEAILQAALNLIYDFPEKAVAEQSELETADGKELRFVLDGEKYYEYLAEKYGYADEASFEFLPAPQFVMLIDQGGYLRSISGTITERSLDAKTPHHITSFIIRYENINGYNSLDFSGLDETKYKDIVQ